MIAVPFAFSSLPERMQQGVFGFFLLCFCWQWFLLPLMVIFSISFPEMKFKLVVMKVCGQDPPTFLSSYFLFSLNILQQYSQPICPVVAVVPAPCLMVQQVFPKPDSDFHLFPLHTMALTALLLLCHCTLFSSPDGCIHSINSFGSALGSIKDDRE